LPPICHLQKWRAAHDRGGDYGRQDVPARELQGDEDGADGAERADYWHGYRYGLRRGYVGKQYGDDKNRQVWLAAAESDDAMRAARGRGYRDGLAA